MERPEQMPAPSRAVYAFALVVFAGVFVAAAVHWSDHRDLIALAAASAVVLALLPGWLYARKGYTFTEGYISGLLAWPLVVAFGLFGPRAS